MKRGLFGRRTAFTVCHANQHGHHGGLAGTGGELQSQTGEAGVGLFACRLDPIQEASTLVAELRGDLGKPDGSFDGFNLTEKRPDATERMVAPVLEQSTRLRRYAPIRLWQCPPSSEFLPQAVDQGSQFVLLVGR